MRTMKRILLTYCPTIRFEPASGNETPLMLDCFAVDVLSEEE